MVDAADAGLIGARDRALILLGFAGAFRRSELVGLDIADCAFGRDGLTVTLRRSKTDQDGAGRKIGIPYRCESRDVSGPHGQAWLAEAGPLFRSINRHGQVQPGSLSGIDVARVVKKLAVRAGLDPAKYAGNSLRAGHATSASIAGASERSIMKQTVTAPFRRSGGTCGMAVCSRRTRRGSWGCDHTACGVLIPQKEDAPHGIHEMRVLLNTPRTNRRLSRTWTFLRGFVALNGVSRSFPGTVLPVFETLVLNRDRSLFRENSAGKLGL
jgi:hypothetical protein